MDELPRDAQLLPFDASALCPKCAHDDIGSLHKRRCGCRESCYPLGYYTDREHMHRWCRRCQFEWFEAPLTDGAAA